MFLNSTSKLNGYEVSLNAGIVCITLGGESVLQWINPTLDRDEWKNDTLIRSYFLSIAEQGLSCREKTLETYTYNLIFLLQWTS